MPAEVVLATFYNFSPAAVHAAMPGVWDTVSPAALQDARFRAVARALDRVDGRLSDDAIAEARSIIDPVVAGLDLAGKALGAANAAVAPPDDPMVALWQQVTVIREWRGDVHIAVLLAHEIGPCDCMVLQVGTGRFPLGVAQATRQWSETEWAASIERLAARGWVDATGRHDRDRRDRARGDRGRHRPPVRADVGRRGRRPRRPSGRADPARPPGDGCGRYVRRAGVTTVSR